MYAALYSQKQALPKQEEKRAEADKKSKGKTVCNFSRVDGLSDS